MGTARRMPRRPFVLADALGGEAGRVFFFQAEDGIRDKLVTGVQTCALPISSPISAAALRHTGNDSPPNPLISGNTTLSTNRRMLLMANPAKHRLLHIKNRARLCAKPRHNMTAHARLVSAQRMYTMAAMVRACPFAGGTHRRTCAACRRVWRRST